MVSFSRIANPDNNCKVGFKMGKFFAEGEGYNNMGRRYGEGNFLIIKNKCHLF